MQTEAPDVFDVRKESEATIKMYGEGSTARGCLTAARLIERGVRMVQIYYAKGDPWDHHFDIELHRKNAKDSDQPFAALIKDLKAARACTTRPSSSAGRNLDARRWSKSAAVSWAARCTTGAITIRTASPCGWRAAAFKRGMVYGSTDDFGWKAVDKPVHVHDLHATILYQLGIDHTKLTYRYSGRDFRLTDVAGKVIHDIIA